MQMIGKTMAKNKSASIGLLASIDAGVLAGAAAVVVLLDAIGNVLSKQATTIGES